MGFVAAKLVGGAAADLAGVRAAAEVYHECADTVRLDVLPQDASGVSTYNGTSYVQSATATTTDGRYMYSGHYDPSGNLFVNKRDMVLGRTVASYGLQSISGNPLFLPVDNDSHNNLSLALDWSGRLHVFANMHGDALRYVRMTTPGDITAWTAPGMIGTEETQVTYPRLVSYSDGALGLLYRDGSSGNGDLYFNYMAPGQLGWVRRGMICAGKANNENPYETRVKVDSRDWTSFAVTWRPNGGDANANADVHLIRSKDRGATWETWGGASVSLPLQHSNTSAKVLATAATDSGIINQFGHDVDEAHDRWYLALQLADDRPDAPGTFDRNIHLLWNDSTGAVRNEQLTDLRNTMSLLNWTTRPSVYVTKAGRVLVTYTTRRFGPKAASVRMIDATPIGDTSPVPREFSICDLQCNDFTITFADDAQRDHDIFRALISSSNDEISNPSPGYEDASLWSRQMAGILSIDMSRIQDVASGRVRLPHINWQLSVSLSVSTALTAQSGATAISGAVPINTLVNYRGRKVFARLSSRSRPSDTTVGTITGTISTDSSTGRPILTVSSGTAPSVGQQVIGTGVAAGTVVVGTKSAGVLFLNSPSNGASGTFTVKGVFYLHVYEFQDSGNQSSSRQIPWTDTTSSAPKGTPAFPLSVGPINGADCQVTTLYRTTGGATGTISGATLAVGVLDGPIYY